MESPTLESLLAHYVQYCSVIRNYAQGTLKNYRNNCGWFLRESVAVYPSDLTKQMFEQWFYKGRLERKWSAATFRHYYKYLNTFLKWLIKEGHMETTPPLVDIEKPRMEQRLPKTLTKDEAQKILDAAFHIPYAYHYERYRNRALIGVMLLAGLRRGEALNLKLNDISLSERTLFVNQGKGSKDRMVPINGSPEGPTFGTPGNCEFDFEIEAGDEVEIFCAHTASCFRALHAGRRVRHLHTVKIDGTHEDHHDYHLPRLLESPDEQGSGDAYVELSRLH